MPGRAYPGLSLAALMWVVVSDPLVPVKTSTLGDYIVETGHSGVVGEARRAVVGHSECGQCFRTSLTIPPPGGVWRGFSDSRVSTGSCLNWHLTVRVAQA